MPRRLLTLLALLAAPLAAAQPSPDAPAPAPGPEQALILDLVKNEARHWSFAIPKGWALAPADVAARMDAEMDRLMPEKGFKCIAVVWADAARGTLGPNIQVQYVAGVTHEQVEATVANAQDLAERRRREREAAGDRIASSDESVPKFDRATGRLTSTGSLAVPRPADPAKPDVIRFENTAFLGREGLTRLIVYAPDAEFADARRQATDALESFQYQPGWGYEPPSARYVISSVLRNSGLGVGAVLAVVFIIRIVTRRKKHAARV